ncbi:dihydroorotate dehydrogenase B (NAD(+)) electron transfer subunit [Abditibacteriota bacterium]|nr:dihydroorotate dehydrogenase B (NAD(+)) electron transfer subunit [Abditibacteriota bacterium]
MTTPQADAPATGRRHTHARVLAKCEVAPRHFALTLSNSGIARTVRAGQFVHVLPHSRENEEDTGWSFDPLLRRAFSILDAREDEFEILFRVEGRGTRSLARAEVGEWLDLLGPLGNGFSLSQASRSAILVGGGVGVPPMVFTARALSERGVESQMLLGARSAADVLCEDKFTSLQIATDDGSRGHHGRVGDLLESALQEQLPDMVFACGPYPMLRAVAHICAAKNVMCEVSLEENMPCGIGVCNGCVVPMRPSEDILEGDDYGRFRRICVHGPACDARDIDWT